MDLVTLVLFLVGLGLLVGGADVLVRGASKLALSVGLSPLIVGLTVVAFGTSTPELAVSVQSAFSGQSDLAFGNVVGSNIFNVLFILGVSALLAPLVVSKQLIRLDVPIMVAASVAAFLFALDGRISPAEGAVLFTGIVAYTVWLVRMGRRQSRAEAEVAATNGEPVAAPQRTLTGLLVQIGLIAAGLAMLVVGSNWLVDGAVAMARALGMSELVIGLTIVAAGTSLPEVAASVVATLRGEREIAVGNVVGSNLYNLLAVLGLSALVSPSGIAVPEGAASFDALVMLAVAIACLPIFFSGFRIERWEGAVFLGYYVAYVAYLVLHASDHPVLPDFRTAVLTFALPLTALTIAVVTLRAWRRDPAAHALR